MGSVLRIALAQINPLVGAIETNAAAIIQAASEARDHHQADLAVFPELTLTGYPPEDLLLRPSLYRRVRSALATIQAEVRGIDLVFGLPTQLEQATYNSAILLRDGELVATYHKQLLPNYLVFDEKRYFSRGDSPCVVDIRGVPVGITICEDIWQPGPARLAVAAGARLLLNLNASPYHLRKYQEREAILKQRVREFAIPIIYVNQVGGQDELVFDGESLVMGARGELKLRAAAFREGVFTVTFAPQQQDVVGGETLLPALPEDESIYRALVLGVHDYVDKNGFKGVVIGLSGGIDSALTLAIAVDALGADRVVAIMMPTRYTSQMSLGDAREQAESLGVRYHELPIELVFQDILELLAKPFAGLPTDTTEENIQARIRGVLLMACSNKWRSMVLTTGNKSEMAVGYATLYGDMAGGFAPLKDVIKTRVYALAKYRNRRGRVIPQRVIDRPPSAELAPDQKDEDSLPPYSLLDPILERFVEQDYSVERLVAEGYDKNVVVSVANMVLRNEYKRRQAPPGVRITRRAFGKDRRYPITSGYARILK
jgi:NAD+ synthase (glutamine-hydrolysing)